MSFFAPGFAAFAVLAAAPIVIHLIGRNRAQVRRFAALDLLLGAERRVARRTRLRHLLLLALRALAIAAIPLVLARPFWETASDLPAAVGGAQSAVLVIDDSMSMSLGRDGRTRLDEAKARARRIVAALGHDAEAAVLTASRGGGAPIGELTADRARLQRAIDAIHPTHRGTDLGGALRRAAQILEAAARPARRVYLISDLAAHGLDSASPWAGLSRPPELVAVDVRGGEVPNLAVAELRVEPARQLGPDGMRITVEVANHGDTTVEELPVTLRVDERPVAKGLLRVPAHDRASKSFFHAFSSKGGAATGRVHEVSAEIAPDALPQDDRRHARVELRRGVRALVIDGDPRTSRRDDEVFYLETALRPDEKAGAAVQITSAGPEVLDGARLADQDVIFLCNVKAPFSAEALREHVRRGGGLFISLGDNVDADAYDATLGDLLPRPLAGMRTAGATAGGHDDGERRASGEGEALARVELRHPLWTGFGAAPGEGEGFEAARFSRYGLFRPVAVDGERPVLLRLQGGAPLLIEGAYGQGRVLVFASSIDRDWNDLPIQPVFLPFIQQAARYLARAPMGQAEVPARIGDRRELPLRQGDTRVEVRFPSGRERLFARGQVSGRRVLSLEDTEELGFYRISAAGQDGVLRPRPQATFAINPDPSESDLRPIAPDRLAALSGPQVGATGPTTATKRRVELWHALGAGLLLLLLGEAILLRHK